MVSEMVERVARALAIYQFGSSDSWEDQIPMARAVIEAMREPTDAMLDYRDAGVENGGSPCGVCGCLVYKGLPTK